MCLVVVQMRRSGKGDKGENYAPCGRVRGLAECLTTVKDSPWNEACETC